MDPTEAMYQCAQVLSSKDVASTSSSDSNNACSSQYVSQSQSPISNDNSDSSPPVQEQSLVRHRSLVGNPQRQLKREMSIVKGPTLDFSPLMTLLQPHTDLNKPPPNWLRRRPPQQRQQSRQFFWSKPVSRYNGSLLFFCTSAVRIFIWVPLKPIKVLMFFPLYNQWWFSHEIKYLHRYTFFVKFKND